MTSSRTGDAFSDVEEDIRRIANNLSGTLGIAVKALETGASFFYNDHISFPAASTIKIHVLLELFNQAKAGKLKLDDPIEIPTARVGPEWGPESDGILKELESVKLVSLKDAATLMMIVSDNVAANLLIELLGFDRINEVIKKLGLRNTKLQRKLMDLQSAARGLENISNPCDMMATLEKIERGEILDADSCRAILDILGRTQDVLGLRRLMPREIRIEHKTGELFDVCSDVGIVRLPGNPFIICIMAKDVNLVQGWDAIAEIGRIFHDRLSAHS